jgi:hypothetical protein
LAILGGGGGSLGSLSGGGGGGGATSAATDTTDTTTTTTNGATVPTDYTGAGQMTGVQVAKMAYNTGFKAPQALINAVAITKRESDWNPISHNTHGEDSYGLWQINMRDDDPRSPFMGRDRARQFGITNYSDLLKPDVNMKAAYSLSNSATEFGPWLTYRPGIQLSDRAVADAKAVIKQAGLGDPVFDTGMATTSMPTASSAPSSNFGRMMAGSSGSPLNIHVTIQSNGNYAYDAKRLATAARPAFEAEYAEVSAKRST